MDDIIVRNDNLPESVDDLSRFVLIGRDRLAAVRAAIRAIDKVGVASEVYQQKLAEGQEIAETVLDAEVRLGELRKAVEHKTGNQYTSANSKHIEIAKTPLQQFDATAQLTKDSASQIEKLASHPDIVERVKAEARDNGELVTRQAVLNAIKADKKARDKAKEVEAKSTAEDDYHAAEITHRHAQHGDIFLLGKHRLMCGDATKSADVLALMDGTQADMILTDPPYGMSLDTDFSGAVSNMADARGNNYDKVIGDNEDFSPELIATYFKNFNYCKEMFLFGADYYAELIPKRNEGSWLCWDKRRESQADGIGSEFELIWSRTKHKRRMLRHDWFGFLSSGDAKDAQNRVHPTQKPISLLCDIIQQWGEGADVIVDLYGGSGSTLIACEHMKRACYMMEIEPKYVDIIIDRWEQLTGSKAVLCAP